MECEFGRRAEEFDVRDGDALGFVSGTERANDEVAVGGPGHGDDEDGSSLLSETKIF